MIRYSKEYMDLENTLLERTSSDTKMSLRKFLALFELNALASMR